MPNPAFFVTIACKINETVAGAPVMLYYENSDKKNGSFPTGERIHTIWAKTK
jgi:hypothetical protein